MSWEEFIQSYEPFIRYLLKHLGVMGEELEEFTQKIIVKCWEKIDSFQTSETPGKFRAWLKTMIRNEIFNDRKRNAMIKKSFRNLKSILMKLRIMR